MATRSADYIWMDGEVVPWEDAKIHVATDAVLSGENVFEGVRAYWNEEQEELYIFKLPEHIRRLRRSARVMRMTIPYGDEEITNACLELMRVNQFRQTIHFRPVVYFGEGDTYAFEPDKIRTGMFILALARPRNPNLFDGVRSCISSWRRNSDLASPSRIKAGPNYHNSRLASVEARLNGFGAPIMLNDRGKVAESPNACFMMVRDGQVITPPVTADILESITRETLIQLFAEEFGLTVQQREVDRTEIYLADEAFFCGSGHEVQPIISVDHYPIGDGQTGPITRQIQGFYFDVVHGRVSRYAHWLTPVYQPAAVLAR